MTLPDLRSLAGHPPLPASGRVYEGSVRVQVGDVDPRGCVRPDALARFVQDLGTADTVDAALDDAETWVLRRCSFAADPLPRLYETLRLRTFCTGTGSRWAERTTHVEGDRGGRTVMQALWIHVSRTSGMPTALPPSFLSLYGEAAAGRTVTSRLRLPKRPDGETSSRPWTTRVSDFDVLDHVNNAIHWSAALDALAAVHGPTAEATAGEVEYRDGIEWDDDVTLHWREAGDDVLAWLVSDRASHATLRLKVSTPGEK